MQSKIHRLCDQLAGVGRKEACAWFLMFGTRIKVVRGAMGLLWTLFPGLVQRKMLRAGTSECRSPPQRPGQEVIST